MTERFPPCAERLGVPVPVIESRLDRKGVNPL